MKESINKLATQTVLSLARSSNCTLYQFCEADYQIEPCIRVAHECTNLSYMRKIRGYTQKELSRKTGCRQYMLANYEAGTSNINLANFETVYKIAKELRCDIEYILENCDTSNSSHD